MLIRLIVMAIFLSAAGSAAALDCGAAAQPCRIAGGEYHIVLPPGWSGGPAVMHLHGYGGSGLKVIRNTGFVEKFTARGYAVIAPTALPWLKDKPNDWSVRDGWAVYPRDDVLFLRQVLADAVSRAQVSADRVLLTGFSRGGSLVWDAACRSPDLAVAYAPVAGGFWLPSTKSCIGPVDLLHTHGFADKVVPLEGRSIRNDAFEVTITQADIFEGMRMWRDQNGCARNAKMHDVTAEFWRKSWSCASGRLQLALHKGGHGLPAGWVQMVLDWFENSDR